MSAKKRGRKIKSLYKKFKKDFKIFKALRLAWEIQSLIIEIAIKQNELKSCKSCKYKYSEEALISHKGEIYETDKLKERLNQCISNLKKFQSMDLRKL